MNIGTLMEWIATSIANCGAFFMALLDSIGATGEFLAFFTLGVVIRFLIVPLVGQKKNQDKVGDQ